MEDERYCFIVEWLDPHSGLTMRYQMLYGPADCSVEMYDIKNRRPFLKKTRIPTVTMDTLHMGAVVTVYSRQLKIVEYGDAHTENAFSLARQSTLCVVKPGAVHLAGKVINAAQRSGFAVARVKMASLSRDDAADLIRSSSSSSDPSGVAAELATGPSVGVALVGDNAVDSFKRLVETELVPALGDCVWCADSAADADARARAYFAKPASCRASNTSLAIVKPSAMANLGLVMDAVCDAGFAMTGAASFTLDRVDAVEFLEVYKGVVPEFAAMVDELTSGAFVAMEVARSEDGGSGGENGVVEALREACGPADPEIARVLRPRSVRAKFGFDKVRNAVHCTDLPEDGELETHYFFKILQA
uniref:DM10 domain-containing protein n=1 Tax=Micromonas pusilla TaxID=38833 RepID=A0A7S0IEW9_MICPS